ncbi:hypothetical protein [Streptomyces sp. BPTC-684]|uniref:hypothetical protein n=1 Tax=Streptomyces sp. BPTC-684 TaxID=3043734 RepID=UPI0024B15603|nr:hypothetical protein [Streptomyces sp. BPTC-684]WHM36004.1 hypothetical protein QIY60_03110 [Streptomyces sp. BPTC-684]
MSILDQYRGARWAPRHGWRPDREVILALRAVITEHLGGEAGDILPSDGLVPDALGAVVAAPSTNGTPRPFVSVRAQLPTSLRADLWGFGTVLAVEMADRRAEPGAGGLLLVGRERHPVIRPGRGLAAALIVQRLGRRPGDCDFRVYRNIDEMKDPLGRAA